MALPRPLTPSRTQAVINEAAARQPAIVSPFTQNLIAATHNVEGKGGLDPRSRGVMIHKLLQELPKIATKKRHERALAYLGKLLPDEETEAHEHILRSVEQVFELEQLAPCFDPATSRSEVSLMGTIETHSGPRPVSGQVDRLAVLDDRIIILDFKTGSTIPADEATIAPDYITQMALYRQLIAQIYPDRPVSCLLVWTHAPDLPKVIELSPSGLDVAMAKIALL